MPAASSDGCCDRYGNWAQSGACAGLSNPLLRPTPRKPPVGGQVGASSCGGSRSSSRRRQGEARWHRVDLPLRSHSARRQRTRRSEASPRLRLDQRPSASPASAEGVGRRRPSREPRRARASARLLGIAADAADDVPQDRGWSRALRGRAHARHRPEMDGYELPRIREAEAEDRDTPALSL